MYRLRVYAPTNGVVLLYVTINGGSSIVYPAGESTPCYDNSNVNASISISPTIASGYVFSRWVINIDGSTEYSNNEHLSLPYNSGWANVFVRLEVIQAQTYYANIAFNANGGAGAPDTMYGQAQTPYIIFTLPYTTPTRTGYAFLGWNRASYATTPEYYPGSTVQIADVSTVSPGPTFTLYAVWQESSQSSARIYNGGWRKAAPMVFNGSYRKATSYVYNNGWRKGI